MNHNCLFYDPKSMHHIGSGAPFSRRSAATLKCADRRWIHISSRRTLELPPYTNTEACRFSHWGGFTQRLQVATGIFMSRTNFPFSIFSQSNFVSQDIRSGTRKVLVVQMDVINI